jgi:hypothetical protein
MFKVVEQADKSRIEDITYSAVGLRLLNSLPALDESDACLG